MKLRLFTTLILALISFSSWSQSRPEWTYKTPLAENNTFVYRVEQAVGPSREVAINKAFIKALQTTSNSLGLMYDSAKVNDALLNGEDFTVISQSINIPINKVCEYTEKNSAGIKAYVIFQVARAGNIQPNFVPFTECGSEFYVSNTASLLKSMVIPGWGQISKKHAGEGILTLIVEAGLIGGAFYYKGLSDDELAIMQTPGISISDFNASQEKYNSYQSTNNSLVYAAVGVYAVNLIRALTLKPKVKSRRVTFDMNMETTNGIYVVNSGLNIKLD